jgi:xylan 1,4-beta-xylosidase
MFDDRHRLPLLLCLFSAALLAQQPTSIQVDAGERLGAFKSNWNYFGYDEPNYTYAKNGRKLIGELSALSASPVHIRAHSLLSTGDGTAAFKWGSTNAYTEDAAGRPIYDWTILDRILDTYVQAGAKPFFEIGFMPKALSSHPDPYVPIWKPGDNFDQYYVGWSYPPKNYDKWGELVYQLVKHSIVEYGESEVASWNWEVWNEPNISYWHGTPEEYDKLYDYTAAAVKRALPAARVGGPGSTGPASPKAAAFLKQFLEHCARTGAPLDFISYHAKGRPDVFQDRVRMGISQELKDTSEGFDIVQSFPKFRNLPIVLTEADPEGCAACSARVYPHNAYRNGTLYPAYEAAAFKAMLELEERRKVNLDGILTWAFEFEGQPYFDGFRTLATNGVDKPVLNFFRMAGMLRGDRVRTQSDGAVKLDDMLAAGVRQHSAIDALATHSGHEMSVMVWNYRDQDVEEDGKGQAAAVGLTMSGLPKDLTRVFVRHYRIDRDHSNAYTAWRRMGAPQNPSSEEYAALEAAGQLELLGSPRWISSKTGTSKIEFSLPLQAISLLQLSW